MTSSEGYLTTSEEYRHLASKGAGAHQTASARLTVRGSNNRGLPAGERAHVHVEGVHVHVEGDEVGGERKERLDQDQDQDHDQDLVGGRKERLKQRLNEEVVLWKEAVEANPNPNP